MGKRKNFYQISRKLGLEETFSRKENGDHILNWGRGKTSANTARAEFTLKGFMLRLYDFT